MINRSLRPVVVALVLICATATVAFSHDLFLKPNAFFAAPNATVRLTALNGTFSTSESSVTADRLLDLAIVGPGGRIKGDTATWNSRGKASKWAVKVGAAGTYVLGASLRPNVIALKGPEFNAYLADDGLYFAAVAAQNLKNCTEARAYLGVIKTKYSKGNSAKAAADLDAAIKKDAKNKAKCTS